jgi:HK97 family phage major capsid protein
MSTLKELREKLETQEAALEAVFAEAKDDKGEYDFTKVKCLGDEVKGSVAVAKKVREMNDAITETAKEIETIDAALKAHADLESRNQPQRTVPHPDGGGDPIAAPAEIKTLGQRITEHPVFKEWLAGDRSSPIEIPDYGLAELKTLFQTTVGWAPESTRTGQLVDAVTRPIQVLDVIPAGQTGQAAVVYMEETVRSHAAAEMAENAAYAEAQFELDEKNSVVRKIGTSIPVTDEQLEDVPMVQGYLEQRLRFGVRQRLDGQVLVGDGNAPNLRGITQVVGILTQAKGGDPVPDAIHKAMTLVRVTGRAQPNVIMLHPNDWQDIRLLRTADGIYIWGSPSEAGPARIWGLPVVIADALTENTGLVGDFANFCSLFERRGIELKIGLDASDFTTGKQHMRADMRTAFVVFRPAAFATVTGI